MMRSMFSAVAGLRNHQTFMDVVGNNIANVNTTGYKGSRVNFQDMLSQTIGGASAPSATRGGVNGAQVGLGMVVGGIDTILTQGNLQSTGRVTDLSLQGDGFFVLNDGARDVYTRDGAFDVDSVGMLVSPKNGARVMGWQADATGVIDTTGPLTGLTIPRGSSMIGQPSSQVTFSGNLDQATANAGTVAVTVPIYDSLGTRRELTLTFTKTGTPNQWTFAYTKTDPTMTIASGATGTLTFDSNGKLLTNSATGTPLVLSFSDGPANISLPDAGNLTGLTQLNATSDIKTVTDGSAAGSLTSFTIGPSGLVTGVYSNGQSRDLAQLAVASFDNPAGMEKLGANTFGPSASSGVAQVGAGATGGRGSIASGFLEMSNVDLAQQFTNMIMAQRGFQANSRVVTTSDEMLSDLVNLKR
jgi:flagellar hook protein FlgE